MKIRGIFRFYSFSQVPYEIKVLGNYPKPGRFLIKLQNVSQNFIKSKLHLKTTPQNY